MRPATAVAKEVPYIETPEEANSKRTGIPVFPPRKNSRRRRARSFLQVLEQVVVGEMLALTLSKSHLE
jgi:hypothetical protein